MTSSNIINPETVEVEEQVTKFYKIRNGAGLWSSGGSPPKFGKFGKVWKSMGMVNAHINSASRDWSQGSGRSRKALPDDWEIVEIVFRESDDTKRVRVNTYVETLERREILTKKYGATFAKITERLVDANQQDEFRWALIQAKSSWGETSALKELRDLLKRNKLKMNTDYRMATDSYGTYTIVFKDKTAAMTIRLTATAILQSVDVLNFIESNLDTDAIDAK